jgi:hypothetical protein
VARHDADSCFTVGSSFRAPRMTRKS